MAPRRRSSKNKDLEGTPNLYERDGYYQYKHPINGTWHPMGTDRAKAKRAANQLNVRLMKPIDLVNRVMVSDAGAVAFAVNRYRAERQPLEGMRPSTLKLENYRLAAIERDLGHIALADLTLRTCAEWLDTFTGNAYTKHRGTLVKVCRFAMAKGLLDVNPAEGTLPNPRLAETKQRKPLKKSQFDAIRAIAPEWFQLAMDFALVTLQRRGDCVKAQYTDIEGNVLKVVQSKTEQHGHRAFLRIEIGDSLAGIIQRSRQIKPLCPYILHRIPERKRPAKGLTHWAQITPDHLSKTFAKYRDQVPELAAMDKDERPTFHEIRGLGGSLYLDAGYSEEFVNLLMGHTSMRMTKGYTDQHQEWTECRADLPL